MSIFAISQFYTIFPTKKHLPMFLFHLVTKTVICTVVATQWNSDGDSKQS